MKLFAYTSIIIALSSVAITDAKPKSSKGGKGKKNKSTKHSDVIEQRLREIHKTVDHVKVKKGGERFDQIRARHAKGNITDDEKEALIWNGKDYKGLDTSDFDGTSALIAALSDPDADTLVNLVTGSGGRRLNWFDDVFDDYKKVECVIGHVGVSAGCGTAIVSGGAVLPADAICAGGIVAEAVMCKGHLGL